MCGAIGGEIAWARPHHRDRRRFACGQIRTFAGAPLSLPQMAARSRLLGSPALTGDCARIVAPTLVISGEPSLDRVVPADGAAEYVRLIPGARAARIERTGHLGYITRPDVFAGIVEHFVPEATAGCERPGSSPGERSPADGGTRPPSSHDDAA